MADVKFYIPREAPDCRCGYEEWSKEAKTVCSCGKPAIVLTKKGIEFIGLCREHAAFFLTERSDCYKDVAKPDKKRAKWKRCNYKEVAELLK